MEKAEKDLIELLRGVCENCNFYSLKPTEDG